MNVDFETMRRAINPIVTPWARDALDRIEARLREAEELAEHQGREALKYEAEARNWRGMYDRVLAKGAAAEARVAELEQEDEQLRMEQDNAGFIPWRAAQDALNDYACEVKRLRAERDRLQDGGDALIRETTRLQARVVELEQALKRIAHDAMPNERVYIAREALKEVVDG